MLDRIRAGELVSRAPEDSPYKDWDGAGVAFLALDAVIAAGPRMTEGDRAALAELLMSRQRQGGWVYREGGLPDADTTASALRALDRLGRKLGLEALEHFYRPRTQLFNTFGGKDDRLALPPQSRQKHAGAHPCVLANAESRWRLALLLLSVAALRHASFQRAARRAGTRARRRALLPGPPVS